MSVIKNNNLILLNVLVFCFVFSGNVNGALPSAVQADKYKILIADSLKNENYRDALKYIGKLEALKVKIPDSILYYKGESYFHVRKWNQAERYLEKYLNKVSSKGKYYKESLKLLGRLEREYVWNENEKIAFGSPLGKAAYNGRLSLVKYLLEDGRYSVNKATANNQTALIFAVQKDHFEIAKELISKGANLNVQSIDYEIFPLESAVIRGNVKIIKLLVSNGADINLVGNMTGRSSLMKTKDRKVKKLLIKLGANLNIQDNDGNTDLHNIIIPDVKYVKKPGGKSLELIASGFKPFTVNDYMIIKLLVENGAALNLKNNSGDTPLDLANKAGLKEIIQLLKKHGAKTGKDI